MLLFEVLHLTFLMKFDSKVRSQIKNHKSIPVIIINFNQLYYLKQLINFLQKRDFSNIVIIDNASSYKPLLEYYRKIKDKVVVESLENNLGHDVFFKNKKLQKKYGKGFYFLTDSDIIPNEKLPDDFATTMLNYLFKYYKRVNKVGFAIDTQNIPDYYPLKEKVNIWEKRYWLAEIEKEVYFANIDTTFALYKPKYPKTFFKLFDFMTGLRLAGNFTCKHGGWYIDPKNLTEENRYYIQTANKSSSWKLDENGKQVSEEYDHFIK
ncbi:hypothetical protein Q73A0000_11190 [Kaistella flava (ex Peng et al. 2021)]|uniref:Glycosyltransferase 2-like domain-containing protein n=1 Tax=Kaistella flava (ex Peng et al. 2021) TaxID=2038776 RepID=A0A7M2Y9U7_9FLAO|nr:hypothetical protein [Kaistella flava (ex Peng et al. 2021)]QOW10880.1 hypothetical protein Q73A0000_11190 [Kaistella flava (ex Peng et al. 2021)]